MKISFACARQYIENLDLSYIIDAICHENYSLPRWSREDAEHCCKLYKNFLLLQKIHGHDSISLVPTREIDEFWHNHILYTKNYMQDCANIFGRYFHHAPANPNEDTQDLIAQFEKTKELYFKVFKEPLKLLKT